MRLASVNALTLCLDVAGVENHFSLRRMIDASADERVLASSKALSKILVCMYVREAS